MFILNKQALFEFTFQLIQSPLLILLLTNTLQIKTFCFKRNFPSTKHIKTRVFKTDPVGIIIK